MQELSVDLHHHSGTEIQLGTYLHLCLRSKTVLKSSETYSANARARRLLKTTTTVHSRTIRIIPYVTHIKL